MRYALGYPPDGLLEVDKLMNMPPFVRLTTVGASTLHVTFEKAPRGREHALEPSAPGAGTAW